MNQKITAFEAAMEELDSAARVMNLNDDAIAYLRQPRRVITVHVPVRMDDGNLKMFTGYRSQHNNALGPVRGGTRFHPAETVDDVKALSFWMTLKNSLAHIPMGGAKGGIVVDPASLSKTEEERLCRSYIDEVFPILGPSVDIPGPDVGTPPQVMAWFMDEYEILNHGYSANAFAGKPILLGGSEGRARATGRGLVYAAEELMKQCGTMLKGKKIVIQGFGNLGSHAAEFFDDAGAIIIGISDVNGGKYNKNGINIKDAVKLVEATGTIKDLKNVEDVTNDELLALKCDILVPAALQNQLNKDNANNVNATYVIEGANGPTTPEGEKIMLDRGIVFYPDIAANVGGVFVSYLETVQDTYHFFWTEEDVYRRVEVVMKTICREVYTLSQKKHVSLRMAAWIVAINRVVEAMQLRGWVRK